MDTTTLILIIVIIALVMFFMNRNRTASRGPYYNDTSPRGNERPTYDDPGYSSSGSIGGSPGGVEVPRERTVGGLETPSSSSGNSPRHDDPNYRSGGSIGG
jgi:hypothetical protein